MPEKEDVISFNGKKNHQIVTVSAMSLPLGIPYDNNNKYVTPIRYKKDHNQSLTPTKASSSKITLILNNNNHQSLRKRNTRSAYSEVPYNVTGWPIGTSLSVEDYVDYFRSTSNLIPDTSRDSSTFEEENSISVLIGIGSVCLLLENYSV